MRLPNPDPIYTIPANFRRIASGIAKKNGITIEQVGVLVLIRAYGEVTQIGGAKLAGYHKEHWRGLLLGLVELGYLDVEINYKAENLYFLSSKGDYLIRGYTILMRRAI